MQPIVLAARHVPKASSNVQQRQRQLKEEHIKDRLSNVPVFAVVNDKDEFVVISSEVTWLRGGARPRGPWFDLKPRETVVV